MTTETLLARAKVNLALHVTGRRADGYHLLDSLVVFADLGDLISVEAAEQLDLRVTGPQAAGLVGEADNLVLRAARAFGIARGALITLEKHLPLASGIGGGSADAAATLRALSRLWQVDLPSAAAVLGLGADVPVCLAGRAMRMQGVGEILTALPPLPPAHLLLVNPGVAVSTPVVFRAMARRENAPLPDQMPDLPDAAALAGFLAEQRNDLEAAALSLAPVIGEVRTAIAGQDGCLLARMSGSGATCFGLFAEAGAVEAAASAIGAAHPEWWVGAAKMVG